MKAMRRRLALPKRSARNSRERYSCFAKLLECARVLASLSALSRYHAKITKIPPSTKKLFAGSPHTKFIVAASAFIWTIAIATSARGVELRAARVTQVVNDVKVLLEKEAPRPVALGDLIRHGAPISTGTQSRSELTFNDLTITRLGTNTVLSFKEGTREMNLVSGAILFQVPKGSGGATIRTAGVTAAITGTTGIGEFHPATARNPHVFSKWLCLEGTFRLYLPNGQSVELGPGQMVTTDGKSFSTVLTFDIARLVNTSLFFTGFDRPLPSLDLIMLEAQNQLASILFAPPTPNPLDPIRIDNVIDQAMVARQTQTPPPPTPSKFGTPSVISSPVPYLITNGTVITTDPLITTNGVTDFGKIYRGPVDDGAFSLWAFGSTSAFDSALGIDDIFFSDPNHLPIAVFKFQSLSLTGDPTIDLSNGGVTKLALIGADGITSGPPGGTLTFTGLDLLVLATVNGSINLTSDVSFQDLHELAMYARGAGSNLTIDSPISNIGILELAAEGSIQLTNPGTMSVGAFEVTAGNNLTLQIGGSLLLNGEVELNTPVLPGTTVANGANVTLNVTGDYTNNSATDSSRLRVRNESAHIGTGGNIGVNIGGNLAAMSDFNLVVQNTNGRIDNGGNITVMTNGSIFTGGEFSLLVENYDDTGNPAGHIGTGGNISVTTGGDLTAGSIDAFINNRNGGTIGSGANIVFDIGGDLMTTQDATFVITNRNDGSGGGVMNGNVTLDLSAANISSGGDLITDISANRGGHILGSAFNHISAAGDLTAHGALDFEIENAGSLLNNGFVRGGTIDMDATINVSAINISATTDFQALISNAGGGHIGGNAVLDISASNGLTSGGDAFFSIINSPNGADTPAGRIGGNATIHANVGSMSVGGLLDAVIDNGNGGSIGGNAIVNFDLSGAIDTQGDADFQIFNGTDGSSAGTIGSDARINVSAANISTGGALTAAIDNRVGTIGSDATINVIAANIAANSLLAQIDNTGGTIGGNAAINMNVSGSATVTNDATVAISGNDPAGSAAININGSYDVGGTFLSRIDGNGTITFNNAGAHADVLKAGVFGTNGVLNVGGGGLSADTTLKLYAPGSNGQLNFVSNVTLGGNSIKILAANSVTIFNNVVVTIGGPNPVDVYVNFLGGIPNANYTGFGGNNSTTGTFAGAGAHNPQPLINAPPFGPSSPAPITTRPRIHPRPPSTVRTGVINVSSSDELLALLDDVHPGRDGRIRMVDSRRGSHGRNASRINTAAYLNAARRAMGRQTASTPAMRRLPQ